MTTKEREKAIYHRLRAIHGDEIKGLGNIAKVLGFSYHTTCRKLSSKEIDLPTIKRGKSVSVFTDEAAKYLAAG